MKRLLSFLIIFVIILSLPIAVNSDIGVYLDGTRLSFDVPPQITDGRTMVPLRVIFEGMGAEVTWNGTTKTVKAVRGDGTVEMTIGSNKMYVNGVSEEMDAVPVIIQGRTLVPARE